MLRSEAVAHCELNIDTRRAYIRSVFMFLRASYWRHNVLPVRLIPAHISC